MKIRSNILTLLLMAATLMWQSCGTEYPGVYYDTSDTRLKNEEITGDYIIVPSLNYTNIFYISSTRGAGAYDKDHYPDIFEDIYMASRFYVMSYRRSVFANGDLSTPSDYSMLMNTPGNDEKNCLVSTELTASGNQNRGKIARPTGLDGVLNFLDDATATTRQTLYWSHKYPEVGYDFFGYHLDDAQITKVTAEQDRTLYNIKVDGSQDIMVGVAPVLTPAHMAENYPSLSDEVRNSIYELSNGGYSAYSVRHGIQPIINLKHLLTRIKFYVLFKNEIDKYGNPTDITITDVRIKGKSNLNICVAARNRDELGLKSADTPEWMNLKQVPVVTRDSRGNAIDIIKNVNITEKLVHPDKIDSLGESIMLAPEDSYEMELTYKQHLVIKDAWATDDGLPEYGDVYRTAKITLRRDNMEQFLAGNTYIVTLSMYGAQRIDVHVDVEPWIYGGESDIIVYPEEERPSTE